MGLLIRLFFKTVRLVLTPFMLLYAALAKPTPISRDTAAQSAVDLQCQQLTLYHFPSCPFCIKVRKEIHRLALPIQLINAQRNSAARAALEQQGGKIQVPCLHIQQDGDEQWLYESAEINQYLQQRFTPTA